MIVLILSDFCWYQRAESKKGHPTKFKGAKLQGWSSTPLLFDVYSGMGIVLLILLWAINVQMDVLPSRKVLLTHVCLKTAPMEVAAL